MKKIPKFLAPVALAAAALVSTQAHAGLIINAQVIQNGFSYIGTYDPTNFDSGLFSDSFGNTYTGAFTDTILFDLSPAGLATMNANFTPAGYISGFTVSLREVASATCGANTATAVGSCTGVTLGSLLTTGTPGSSSSNIGFTSLAAGLYAIVVTGTVTSAPVLYSGQLSTSVPEPGTLALLGLGLVGLGFARRRKNA